MLLFVLEANSFGQTDMAKRPKLMAAILGGIGGIVVTFLGAGATDIIWPEFKDWVGLTDRFLDNPRKICTAGGYIKKRVAGDVHMSIILSNSSYYTDCREWVRKYTDADNMRLDCLVHKRIYMGTSVGKDFFNASNLDILVPVTVKCGWEDLPIP